MSESLCARHADNILALAKKPYLAVLTYDSSPCSSSSCPRSSSPQCCYIETDRIHRQLTSQIPPVIIPHPAKSPFLLPHYPTKDSLIMISLHQPVTGDSPQHNRIRMKMERHQHTTSYRRRTTIVSYCHTEHSNNSNNSMTVVFLLRVL